MLLFFYILFSAIFFTVAGYKMYSFPRWTGTYIIHNRSESDIRKAA